MSRSLLLVLCVTLSSVSPHKIDLFVTELEAPIYQITFITGDSAESNRLISEGATTTGWPKSMSEALITSTGSKNVKTKERLMYFQTVLYTETVNKRLVGKMFKKVDAHHWWASKKRVSREFEWKCWDSESFTSPIMGTHFLKLVVYLLKVHIYVLIWTIIGARKFWLILVTTNRSSTENCDLLIRGKWECTAKSKISHWKTLKSW